MVGWRPSHKYPQGKPYPIILADSAAGVLCLLWVFLAGRHWWLALLIIAAAVGVAFVDTRLHKKYERTGSSVPIVYPPNRQVSFPEGRPLALRVLRVGFVVLAAVLIALGLAPIPWSIARIAMVATVLSVVAVGFLHFFLEGAYAERKERLQGGRLLNGDTNTN